MRTAIMGAGSLGTILGAYLSKAGRPVELIDANVAHVAALNEHGAKIIGKSEFTAPVKAITPDQMEGVYDTVIFLVKQTFNDTALSQLKNHLDGNSTVCTLQNGIPEYSVSKVLGAERVVGGVVGWGASMIGPGVSEVTSAEAKREFDIGELDGKMTDRIVRIKELLELMCPTNILDNLMGLRWNKIIANSALSGMSAVTGGTFGDVLDNPEALLRAKFIANECIDVCRASGVRMAVRHGYDHGNLLHFETHSEMLVKDWLFKEIWGPHRNLKASMLQDLEKGIKSEISYINGTVVDVGKEHNVPTPVNKQVVDIVKRIEAGELKSEMANVALIAVPEIA